MSKGNPSAMNSAKTVNNSQPLFSSLHIPHHVYMKHTIPVISNISVGASLVQCYPIRQMLYIFYTQKNGGVCDAAENPSLLVKALCVVVFCNIYIYC